MFNDAALRLFAARGQFTFGLKDGHRQHKAELSTAWNLRLPMVRAAGQLSHWSSDSTYAGFVLAAQSRNRQFSGIEVLAGVCKDFWCSYHVKI